MAPRQELRLREARRLYDLAARIYSRTEGSVASALILQKSIFTSLTALLEVHTDATPSDYGDAVEQAARLNRNHRLVDTDLLEPLMTLAEVGAASTSTVGNAKVSAPLVTRYQEIFEWAPDLLRAVERHLAAEPKRAWFGAVPLSAFIVTRSLLLIIGYASERVWPFSHPSPTGSPLSPWVAPWIRWDAPWYYSVVARGYDALRAGEPANVVFFPLFPVISRVVSVLFLPLFPEETAYYYGAAIVSHVAFLFALEGTHRLARVLDGRRSADSATWLLAAFPFSLFFSAPYPQALLLALAVWTFERARAGRWRAASVLASLGAVTGLHGLLLPVALAMLRWRKRWRAQDWLLLGIATLGPALYMLFLGARYGNPVAFVSAYFNQWSGHWGSSHFVGEVAFLRSDPPLTEGLPFALEFALVPVVAVLSVVVWLRLGAPYALFAAAPLLMGIGSTMSGFGRFVSVAFPLFLVAGRSMKHRRALTLVCLACGACLALFTVSYCHWEHVGGP